MQLVHFASKLEVGNGEYTLRSEPRWPYIANIEFTSDFSNDSTPSTTSVTIHGLTRKTALKFYEGETVSIYAGFYNADYTQNNIGYIMGGTINQIQPLFNDEGDWQLQFTIQDGANYDSVAVLKEKVSKSVRSRATLQSNPKLVRKYQRLRDQLDDKFKAQRERQYGSLRDSREVALNNLEQEEKAARSGKSRDERITITREYNKKRSALRAQYKTNPYTEQYSAQEKAARAKLLTQEKNEAAQDAQDNAKAEKVSVKYTYKPIYYKPKSTGKQIIVDIARRAGFKIHTLSLVKNKIFKKGYRATKKPMQCIQEIARDCDTDVIYQHGGLCIMGFSRQKKLKYLATVHTGLINPPQLQVDDSSDTSNATTNNSKKKRQKKAQQTPSQVLSNELKNGTYQATMALNSVITTGSIFRIKDELTQFDDWVIVTAGEHAYSSGSVPTTQITFELFSKYQKDQVMQITKAKSAEHRKELAKDREHIRHAKAIKAIRTAARKRG